MANGVDTSSYANALTAPSSPLDMMGKYQGIANAMQQNQILQQEIPLYQARVGVEQQNLAQQQMETQLKQGHLNANQIIANTPRMANGQYDTNAMKMKAAVSDPNALPHIIDFANGQYGSLGNAGLDASGAAQLATPGQITAAQERKVASPTAVAPSQSDSTSESSTPAPTADEGMPTTRGGLAPGTLEAVTQSQKDVNAVRNAAAQVPTVDSAFAKMQELSKSGANTGTMLGAFHQYLAAHNMAYPGAESDAANLAEFKKYSNQVAQNSGTGLDSDFRLQSRLDSITTADQIPDAVQNLVPYLRAANAGIKTRNDYYTKKGVGIGADPVLTQKVAQEFNDNWNPRVGEYNSLPKAEQSAYVAKMSPADRAALKKAKEWEAILASPNGK